MLPDFSLNNFSVVLCCNSIFRRHFGCLRQMEGASGVETETPGRTRRSSPSNAASDGGASSRRNSVGQPGPSTPSPLLPGLSRDVAIEEAQRIMKTINRMAADESLGWSELGVASHRWDLTDHEAVGCTGIVR